MRCSVRAQSLGPKVSAFHSHINQINGNENELTKPNLNLRLPNIELPSIVCVRFMGDHGGDHEDKIHGHDSPSDSDNAKLTDVKPKVYRLFGREKPVHQVFGAGKAADVFLWRDKKVTAGVLGVATAVWVLFELVEYHLLTLVGHLLIFGLAVLFLWSHVATFIKKSPPRIPDVVISEDIVLGVASAFRIEINRAFFDLREIASGRDIKKFLSVIAGLWVISVLGSWWNFLTLFYISFVLLHTVPLLYEKYEDQVDKFGEKAEAEIKKQYAVIYANVLSKIPVGPLKDKKQS